MTGRGSANVPVSSSRGCRADFPHITTSPVETEGTGKTDDMALIESTELHTESRSWLLPIFLAVSAVSLTASFSLLVAAVVIH